MPRCTVTSRASTGSRDSWTRTPLDVAGQRVRRVTAMSRGGQRATCVTHAACRAPASAAPRPAEHERGDPLGVRVSDSAGTNEGMPRWTRCQTSRLAARLDIALSRQPADRRRGEGVPSRSSVADPPRATPTGGRTSASHVPPTRSPRPWAERCVALASPSAHGPLDLLRRHRRLGAHAAARAARDPASRGRRADPVRLRRGHPAPAAAQHRAAGPGRDLHHPPAPGPLARAAGDDQDLRHARPRRGRWSSSARRA